jgi:hypothetical protein
MMSGKAEKKKWGFFSCHQMGGQENQISSNSTSIS